MKTPISILCLLAILSPLAQAVETPLPAVHCVYNIQDIESDAHEDHDHAHSESYTLTVWRSDDIVTLTDSRSKPVMYETWRRSPQDTLFCTRTLPEWQYKVYYFPGDIKQLAHQPNWEVLTGQISYDYLTEHLEKSGKTEAYMGHPTETFTGHVKGIDYKVVWLTDVRLAALIEQVKKDQTLTMTLDSIEDWDPATQPPLDDAHYKEIDYVDIADNESDPMAIMYSKLAGIHDHAGHGH